jgi:hypothetical protein
MNGISEYHKRRVYSSSIIMDSSINLLQIEYFTKVDVQEEEIEVHFSDNFGEGFGGITDSELDQTDGYLYIVSIGQWKIFKIIPS